MPKVLIPIFADQLSHNLSSIAVSEPEECIILMMEVMHEADTVPHHRTKLVFLFSAMRHFSEELREQGWTVDYVKLTDKNNKGTFRKEVKRALSHHDVDQIRVCEPSIYRVLKDVQGWESALEIPVTITPDDRFITSKEEFSDWAKDRKTYRMENFYHDIRRKTGLLMEGDKPVEGKWNFDKQNRKPPKDNMNFPEALKFMPDETTQNVVKMVNELFKSRIGNTDEFFYAVTREVALDVLDFFVENQLSQFGDYQDAMVTDQPFMFHSIISPYINTGLISPMEVCERVETAYLNGKVPINAAEGYIRQIIGWREYVRGIYWLEMPGYKTQNFLEADLKLPDFYWTGDTEMHCLSQTISQTLNYAYAHHIQRLMITGNFAQLIGVDPYDVHEWYLSVYLDAFEWVELPNTLGMSQYADGGLLGSKPYISSGSYINRMSDYCKNCSYNVKDRIGEKACPFNSLYWHFLHRNRDKLEANNRLAMPYRNLAKMDEQTRDELIQHAEAFIDSLTLSMAKDYK